MTRVCTVCAHPQRPEIDKALIAGGSFRGVSRTFSVSEDALFRHRQEHVAVTLAQAQQQEDVRNAIDVYAQLRAINAATLSVLKEAREARDGDLALKAIDRVQKQIELQAKLIGELDERPQVNVTITTEWIEIRAVIVTALEDHPSARLAVVEALEARGVAS